MPEPSEFASVEELVSRLPEGGVHIECGPEMSRRAYRGLRESCGRRRCAYHFADDRGYERETVASYLTFFARIAGGAVTPAEAMDRFGLRERARTRVGRLSASDQVLLGIARLVLFEPEACFLERPLSSLDAPARKVVLRWMTEESRQGTVFVTAGQPLREALLMPGTAWWVDEDGRVERAQTEVPGTDGATAAAADEDAEGPEEVHVCKIACRSGATTLLFDPREIDFIESSNRSNYASVRGDLYQTAMTMDELEAELERYGFFRCHRSFIVNVQKVCSIERYTRNSFNLLLSDAAHSSIPLAKGRAEAMRERFGLR